MIPQEQLDRALSLLQVYKLSHVAEVLGVTPNDLRAALEAQGWKLLGRIPHKPVFAEAPKHTTQPPLDFASIDWVALRKFLGDTK